MPIPRLRPQPRTLRRIAALLLMLAVLPGTVVRDRAPRWDHSRALAVVRLDTAPAATPQASRALGPFHLSGAWQLTSNDSRFGGYSALLARSEGRLLAISDRGTWLDFAEPLGNGPLGRPVPSRDHTSGRVIRFGKQWIAPGDAEAATADGDPGQPGTHIWISWEDRRAVSRFDSSPAPGWFGERRAFPPALKNWSSQYGAEAMVRLADGRFILISEDFAFRSYERRHKTVVFPGDPTAPDAAAPATGVLTVDEGYRPTDMARLPDGRVLVLLRRLVWPMPLRFSCRIALADPQDLLRTGRWTARTLAHLDPPLPTDNYEGLTVRQRTDGKVDAWVISDDNRGTTQRTLLLKLALDPKELPARGQ